MRLYLSTKRLTDWLRCMKTAYADLGLQVDRLCLSDNIFDPFCQLFMSPGYTGSDVELKRSRIQTKGPDGKQLEVFDFYLLGVRVHFTRLPTSKHLLVLSQIGATTEGPKA